MIKINTKYTPYKIKDITQAKWGREEIELPTEIFPTEDWKIKRLKNFLNKKHKRLAKLL